MTYLLDTHYMLWAVADTRKISKKVKDIITNPTHRLVVSAVSFWEVSLKTSLGKLAITGFAPNDLPDACMKIGFDIEHLMAAECSTYHQLKATYHKDPFDRMLIWHAIRHDYILISADENIKRYATEGLKVFTGK
jgi:PIN domain nuclease of toxin-antitoxin system